MASQMHFGVASSAMQLPDVYMLEQTRRAIGCAATWSEEGDQQHYENIMKVHVRLSAIL